VKIKKSNTQNKQLPKRQSSLNLVTLPVGHFQTIVVLVDKTQFKNFFFQKSKILFNPTCQKIIWNIIFDIILYIFKSAVYLQ
jgi:hypothetical protein